MKLVDDWRSCLKWFSVQAMVVAGAVQAVWFNLPEDFKQSVPDQWITATTVGLMLAGVVGRLVDQE